MIQGKA